MRLLIGRSGSGKTTAILDEIAQKCERVEGKQILLVPELHSHRYERKLAEKTKNHGARTAEVLTFSRLADRVFSSAGGLAQQMLSPAGQLLTMQMAATQVQSGLSVYNDLADKTEVLQQVCRLIDEMKTCMITSEQLFASAEACEDAALAGKLYDIAQLYTAYDRICEQSLPDPRTRLSRLAELLPESGVLDGAQVYLDGFLGFTPQERQVVECIVSLGCPVCCSLTTAPGQEMIFYSASRTQKMLTRMAQKHGQTAEVLSLGESKIKRAADLTALEQYSLLAVPPSQPSDRQSVCLYAGLSPMEECEHAAAEIRRIVRETGCRFRDFVITARDIDAYTAPLQMAMSRYDIPIYLAIKPDLLSRPPLKLVTAALAALQSGYAYEDLFACLKTGLAGLTTEETDRLENYVLTWNIRGSVWTREWDMHPGGYGLTLDDAAQVQLTDLNALRRKAIEPFETMRQAMSGQIGARDCAAALYTFLETVHAPEAIAQRADALGAAGQTQLAEEYRQLWEILVGALEQFAWVLGEKTLTLQQFVQLICLVLEEYDVGTIPTSLDHVACGEIDRVCGESAKTVILLGVNDGIIPLIQQGTSLLSDHDRLLLQGLGIELKASGAERLFMEQETLYRAISCPSERLILSYHVKSMDGKDAGPSYYIGMVRKLLDGVTVQDGAVQHGLDCLQAEVPAIELACAFLSGDSDEPVRAAYAHYKQDERVCAAEHQRLSRGPLTDRNTIGGLYGHALNLTASRVDTFYSCRFAYFMQYGLKAKARRQARFDAPQTGTFIHYVLEHVLAACATDGGTAAKAAPAQIHTACRQAVKTYVEEELGGLEQKTPRFRYLFQRLVKSIEQILQNVIDELRVSDFRPIDFEVDFSRSGDLPPVQTQQDDVSISLSGKVDRVDGYIKNGKLYLRIMDYKSGRKAFSLSDIWHGLNMQLIVYLYALQQTGLERYRKKLAAQLDEIVPAGVLYVPARDDLPDAARDQSDEALQEMRDQALRRSGLLSDDVSLLDAMEHGLQDTKKYIPVSLKVDAEDPEKRVPDVKSAVASLAQFGKLARYTHQKLLEMGQALQDGDITADPRRKDKTSIYCDWCEFRAACHFDETAGDRGRLLRHLSDEDFWNRIGGEHDARMDRSTANSD